MRCLWPVWRRLTDGVEFCKYILLYLKILKYRFNYNVGIPEIAVVGGAGNESLFTRSYWLENFPFFHGKRIVFCNDIFASLQGFFIYF